MSILVANRLLPPRALTPPVLLQIEAKEISENMLNGFCISCSHSPASNGNTRNHPKPSLPYDLGLGSGSFVRMDLNHELMHQENQ